MSFFIVGRLAHPCWIRGRAVTTAGAMHWGPSTRGPRGTHHIFFFKNLKNAYFFKKIFKSQGGPEAPIIYFFQKFQRYMFFQNSKFVTIQFFSSIFYIPLFYARLRTSDLCALCNEFCFMTLLYVMSSNGFAMAVL